MPLALRNGFEHPKLEVNYPVLEFFLTFLARNTLKMALVVY